MPLLLIVVKVTVLLSVALLLTVVMQRASAGSRHLVWLVALGGLLLVPALATWGPLHWRVLPQSLATSAATLLTPPAVHPTTSPLNTPPPAARVPITETGAPTMTRGATPHVGIVATVREHLATVLLLLWLAIGLTLLLWLAYGALAVQRIVRRAALLEHPDWHGPLYEIADRLGLDAAPRLLRSEDVKMPFACGLLRCTIVLPAESDAWSAERRSAVLIHELGHVRRHDLVGHTLGRIACALYWFHPMVWTAARRLRAESERACDDLALVFGARPSDYAEHLLDIVSCVRDHATPSVALAMAHRKEFEGRMLAILDPELRRTAFSRIQTFSLVGAVGLVAVVISAAAPAPPAVAGSQVGLVNTAPGLPADTGLTAGTSLRHSHLHTNVRVDTRTDVHVAKAISRVTSIDAAISPADTTTRVALLTQLLRDDTAAGVRRIAAWGLSRYAQSASVRQALGAALAHDGDEDVREMAAWALADAGSGDLAALSTAAISDLSSPVRETAVWALGEQGDAGNAETLARALAGDHDETVRGTAAWALGSIGVVTAPKALRDALGDSDEDVRLKAAWALSEIADSTALPTIRAALRRETSSQVQRAELRALIRGGEDPEKMVEWLKSKDPELRQMAARGLAGGEASDPWPWPWPRPRPMAR